ncbi:MAG: hypothetical protein GY796_00030, partial [Chloroflexi bacterium]|nr:hypothetical protein [Chloroflexota bacterium]
MSEPSKTQWHTLLGKFLETLLTPVGIDVSTNVAVMSSPPEADILLLRRHRAHWSAEQMARLPDGIRNSKASHVLIEFKYTESFNNHAMRQAIGYDYFYQQAHELKRHDLQTVVASAKTPRKATLERLGYTETTCEGVYRSQYSVLEDIVLLVLNELADTPHNAPIKCFASRRQVKRNALTTLRHGDLSVHSKKFWWLLHGLWNYWFSQGGDNMTEDVL